MKYHMLSLVVGENKCTSGCPFCVSGERTQTLQPINTNIESKKLLKRMGTVINLAENSNVDTAMLTSRGETMLYPNDITTYLNWLQISKIPIIELQTNGVLIEKRWDIYKDYLEDWWEKGLTTIVISTVSEKYDINKSVYTPESDYIDLEDVIKKLHAIGYSVRLTCVMCDPWMNSEKDLVDYLKFAKKNKVEQVTMRPLNDEYRRESAQNWINGHKVNDVRLNEMREFLSIHGTKLMKIPRVGTVYDWEGQNVMFSDPLNKNIRTADYESARNLILFRDGRIAYEWEMEGATLL